MTTTVWEYGCFSPPEPRNILMSTSSEAITTWLNDMARDGWEPITSTNDARQWIFRRLYRNTERMYMGER